MELADSVAVVTAEERPDLWEASRGLFLDVWPEYNLHGNDTGTYFGALFPRHARFQVLILERETDHVIARGRTIPFTWDGTLEDLPSGIDAVGLRAVNDSRTPTTLSALAAEVATDRRRQGLSRLVLEGMAAAGRAAGFDALVAPVRPNLKHRYPLVPIERYVEWTDTGGQPFDPWLRIHERMGATVLRTEPESLRIEAPVAEWEQWTEMRFPEDGEYVFPEGLSTLRVDGGVGTYWEPNVWMLHRL